MARFGCTSPGVAVMTIPDLTPTPPPCPVCRDNGHDPKAPWFLCPEGCAAAARIRLRSGDMLAGTPAPPHR